MSLSRLLALIRKEFLQIRRDPRTLVLVLVIPIMQMFLMGYSATNDIRNVPLAVLDNDRSPQSRTLLSAYRAADYFRVTAEANSEQELRTMIDDGHVRAGVIIPQGYGKQIAGGGSAQILFILDGSDPTVASTALSAAQLIGQSYSTTILSQRLERRGAAQALLPPLQVLTQVWYNPDLISAWFMIPGVIGVILQALTSILTATAIVRERERGTIEQLIVTPIRPLELIIGKILPYVLLSFFNAFEVIALGHWWFGVPVRGDLMLIALMSGLFLLSSLGIGILASTIANTQQEAMLIVWMTLLPSIFLSGFFFPLEAMPPVLQVFSYLTPLRYYLVIIRSLMLKGVGVSAFPSEIAALCVYGVVIMTLAALRFRKRLD
ncbi:MAG: ABC transporter permease [Anaerolineales bacterium]|jgi:ABC-2 type transport system permease protein